MVAQLLTKARLETNGCVSSRRRVSPQPDAACPADCDVPEGLQGPDRLVIDPARFNGSAVEFPGREEIRRVSIGGTSVINKNAAAIRYGLSF